MGSDQDGIRVYNGVYLGLHITEAALLGFVSVSNSGIAVGVPLQSWEEILCKCLRD